MRHLAISLLLITTTFAHTDLSTTIKALSAKIAEKPNAELFYQRATEYRALRESKHAIEDLQKALELKPGHPASIVALAELYGPNEKAYGLLYSYTATASSPSEKLESLFLLARHLHLTGKNNEALALFPKIQAIPATVKRDTEIDLLHAGILLNLDRSPEAAAVLNAAWRRTDSIVLRNNWIDTALTAGQTKEVLPIIEHELHSSRLRSSWLIRRARALLILDKEEAAKTDLRSALLEIHQRIDPEQPDLTLIADRGLIHALMGNPALARHDLATLKKTTLPPSSYRLLSKELHREPESSE